MKPAAFNLTDAERRRVERIDRLVALGPESVEELLLGMSDPSWTVRRAVVGALVALGDDAVGPLCHWLAHVRTSEAAIAAAVDALSASTASTVTPQVTALLDDPRPPVAADAAQILGRRRATPAAPRLARLLEHADDNVAVSAIEALGLIGGETAVDALIEVLERRSFFRTFPAMQVLSRLDDLRVIEPIARLLDDETYRFEAARALGRTGHPHAIAPLVALIDTGGDAVVRLVAQALAELMMRAAWTGAVSHIVETMRARVRPYLPRLTSALHAADAAERTAIASVLGEAGDVSVIPDLTRLLDDAAVRDVAIEAIQRITRSSADAALAALSHGDAAIRAAVLPVVSSARAVQTVRALLVDEDPEIRARACEALARIGDSSVLPALFEALADPNPRVCHAATVAIHSLGSDDTTRLAIGALQQGTQTVRRYVLRIIGYFGLADAYDAVVAAARDRDLAVAETAVTALATLPRPEVDAALAELARDPRERIRAAAMRAAAVRGTEASAHLLEEGLADDAAWVRYYACQGLGRMRRVGATPLVIARLSDASPHVRVGAIEALGHLDTQATWQALKSALHASDEDERRAALASIGLQPRDHALPLLLEAARSTDVATRLIALSGLSRCSERSAIDSLGDAAADADQQIRDAAIALLAEHADPRATRVLIDLALEAAPDHPVHGALSRATPERIASLAERAARANAHDATVLVAALARMRDPAAVAAMFTLLRADNPIARRTAATMLIASGAPGARVAIAKLAHDDPDPDVRSVCAAASRG